MKRIAIVTGFSLACNPRVIKEASTLAGVGHEVIVLGAELDRGGLERDQSIAASSGFKYRSVGSLIGRNSWPQLRTRFGVSLFRRAKISNRYQLGYFAPELLRCAFQTNADYYIVHLEQALWVGLKLLHAGRRVGIDMEDWFSEDLPLEAKRLRPLEMLRALECELLQKASHSTTTSKSLSKALAKNYKCPEPIVTYNAFKWADRQFIDGRFKDRRSRDVQSIHWFSQTLGRDRGLEDLLAALPYLTRRVEIHLRGTPASGFGEWLATKLSEDLSARVFVHPVVSNEELLSRVAEHDIGFAGEGKYCKNKNLTVSNKMLHYLLGGLAVAASDTEGQCEVADQASGAVMIYRAGDAKHLANCLNFLISSGTQLASAKAAALKAAEQKFCWEKQETRFLSAIEGSFRFPIHNRDRPM